jgi:hypothetical protein
VSSIELLIGRGEPIQIGSNFEVVLQDMGFDFWIMGSLTTNLFSIAGVLVGTNKFNP